MEALGRASMAACQPQGQAGCWLSGSTSPGTLCLRGGGCCTVRHCGRGCPPWSLAVTDLSSTRGTILVGQVCCPGRRRSLCINSLHKHVLSTYCVPASQRGSLWAPLFHLILITSPCGGDSCGSPAEEGARDQSSGINLIVTARKPRVRTQLGLISEVMLLKTIPGARWWQKGAPEDPHLPPQGQRLL